jgi:cytidylate kinase
MYRAVALAASLRYTDAELDEPTIVRQLGELLNSILITFDGARVKLDGRDISDSITTPRIGDLASRLSALPIVRERMRDLQRVAGAAGGVVMEGRDIGTVIFPDAEFKFYLTADVAIRAERRWMELQAKGERITRDEVLARLQERDQRDQGRALAPLKPADDAIVVDSSKLEVDQVVALMKTHIEGGSPN